MTTLGKTLTVIIALLSICLMMFASAVYTAGRNWRSEANGLREQLAGANQRIARSENELANVQMDLNQKFEEANDRANKAEASVDQLQDENEQKENELVSTRQERDVSIRQSDIANQEAEFKRLEAERLRQVIAKLHTDINELSKQNRQSNDEVYNRDVEIATIKEKQSRLLFQYATLKEVLAHNNIDPDPETHKGLTAPPPSVEGLVLDTITITRNNTKLVEVSVGSDDGLALGHKMYITRPQAADGTPAQYLGEVEIIKVTPDRSVGRLVLNTKNGIIARGDNVTTKL
ncbi:Chromosome partition protein Smc [Polystyrenella longa]|uniref:Chromosome partition protein Smc n=1 Tax=Polystyrenella longa TaxID=2528007 RepID=A0A518CIY0_9PLAN|nr:hypothetical protein [Polystyrenella longa]QDU79183.1 Chromosome partition protein Smc [Polystyrenella longa]